MDFFELVGDCWLRFYGKIRGFSLENKDISGLVGVLDSTVRVDYLQSLE